MTKLLNAAFSFLYAILLAIITEKVLSLLSRLFCTVLVNGKTGFDAFMMKMLAALLAFAVGIGAIYALTIVICQKVADFTGRFEE